MGTAAERQRDVHGKASGTREPFSVNQIKAPKNRNFTAAASTPQTDTVQDLQTHLQAFRLPISRAQENSLPFRVPESFLSRFKVINQPCPPSPHSVASVSTNEAAGSLPSFICCCRDPRAARRRVARQSVHATKKSERQIKAPEEKRRPVNAPKTCEGRGAKSTRTRHSFRRSRNYLPVRTDRPLHPPPFHSAAQ